MTTIQERVEAGAVWLDEHRPGWVDRIDLETLDMDSETRCVLGQLHGDYAHPDSWAARENPFGRGFNHMDESAEELTDTWRDYIVERRATVLPHGGEHCSCVIPCETCGADMLTTGYLAGCEECSERRQCAYDRAEFGDQLAPGGAS